MILKLQFVRRSGSRQNMCMDCMGADIGSVLIARILKKEWK